MSGFDRTNERETDLTPCIGSGEWWTTIIVAYATLGGVILGFYSLAMAVRDGGSIPYALFGLSVASAGCLAILDGLAKFFGLAKGRRYTLMGLGTCVVLGGMIAILISRFVF